MGRVKEENLSASLEDYLEAISHIVAEKKAARAKDIALRMKVNKSSVTGALHALSNKGLINYAPYDIITLTPKGESSARRIVKRHEVLEEFFHKVLGVSEAEAEENACKMEHALSAAVLKRLVHLIGFFEEEPKSDRSDLERFRAYSEHREAKGRPREKGTRSRGRKRR